MSTENEERPSTDHVDDSKCFGVLLTINPSNAIRYRNSHIHQFSQSMHMRMSSASDSNSMGTTGYTTGWAGVQLLH